MGVSVLDKSPCIIYIDTYYLLINYSLILLILYDLARSYHLLIRQNVIGKFNL